MTGSVYNCVRWFISPLLLLLLLLLLPPTNGRIASFPEFVNAAKHDFSTFLTLIALYFIEISREE